MRSIVSLSLLTLLVTGMLLVGGCSVGQLDMPEHEVVSETSDKNSDYEALYLDVVTDEEDGEDVASSLAEQNSDYDYVSANLFESKTAANRYEPFAYYEYSHTEAGEENFEVAEGEGVYEDNPDAGYEGEAPTEDAMNYGDDEYLDGLYDECEAGDADACEELYMQSPVDSEYEAFAMENGGGYGGEGGFEETTTTPEPEEVALGETFETQGFEWTFTEAEIQAERPEAEAYGDPNTLVEGPFVVLVGSVTNVSDEYETPDAMEVDLYTDQTSHNVGGSMHFTLDEDEDLFTGEVAPEASKAGLLVIQIDSADEQPLYFEWSNPESFMPEVRLNIEDEV
jgi:hypothetical protein